MKKLRMILLILAAVLLTAALAAGIAVFTMTNGHYFLNLKFMAGAPTPGRAVVTPLEDGGVRVSFPGDEDRWVCFDAQRRVTEAQGITPIGFDRSNFWGLWSYEAFVAEYGPFHQDVGNNVFHPAWITADGYLITMWCAGSDWMNLSFTIGNYGEVEVFDLLAD